MGTSGRRRGVPEEVRIREEQGTIETSRKEREGIMTEEKGNPVGNGRKDMEVDDYITMGEKYGPAMKIETQEEANEYLERCVRHNMNFGNTREEAESIEKSNLGYYAGYYDDETRRRVERLFKCAHPVFGSIEEKGPPTLREAFELGMRMGRTHK